MIDLARLRGWPASRAREEAGLATLVLDIASINLWNRLNAGVRQVVGAWG